MKSKLLILFVSIIAMLLPSCNHKKDVDNVYSQPETQTQVMAVPEKTEEEKIVEYRTSFVGCGDNIIYGTKDARKNAVEGGRQFNYKPFYNGVSDIIKDADISFINQETLMCGDGYSLSYYPMFNSPQDAGLDLIDLGYDVVNISNNHMLDKGADGLAKTIEFWKSQDVLMIGGYENQEDYDNIRVLEKNGLTIAFLSYTYATNGLTKSSSSPIVIPYINDEDIIRQTALARECADMVFVSVHWGDEGSFIPNDEQKRVAKLFADSGVDVILGHHPHVIQPVEWLCGVNGNKTLCVYSLGNFMAQQDYAYNMVGGIIGFDIVHSETTGPYLDNVVFTPTVFHFTGDFYNNNIYRMEDYTGELASVHGVKTYYGHSISYDILRGYVDKTISPEFLPEYFKNEKFTQVN